MVRLVCLLDRCFQKEIIEHMCWSCILLFFGCLFGGILVFTDFAHIYCVNDLSVTRNYFENLVRALENGLSDVDSHGACSRTTSSKGLGGGSSRGKGGRVKGSTSRSSGPSRNIDDSGHWSCEHCTFANIKSATICAMCQQRR